MNLLPSELIQNGIDTYLSKYPATSRKIYWLVMGFVVVVLGALPFIYVDLSVQDSGIICPFAEKATDPDSMLYAEINVSQRNIGYITKDMPVNIQISSFNYNEWGSVSGKVTEISSDFIANVSGNNVCYKVKCSLDKNHLLRKNGVKGWLKKGMSVSAHFRITRRSLFDLLYQKMDDWVNPSQYEK